MGGASSFIAMLCIAGFLTAAWLATKVSQAAGVSSIVLEITTGVLLGPNVLGLIAPEYAVCQAKRHLDCTIDMNVLNERIAVGTTQAMGETYAQIANMGFCNRADYEHHDDSQDASHETTETEAQATDAPTPCGPSATAPTGAPYRLCAPTGGSQEDIDAIQAAIAAMQTMPLPTTAPAAHRRLEADTWGPAFFRQQRGEHLNDRRLSGGGKFTSYGQCLVKSCEAEVSHQCSSAPDFFTLIGHTGVALMIFESGMHFDFEKAVIVGPKACAVAVIGTILPLITGSVLTMIYGYPFLPDAVAVGTALAPTSVGIALRLLGEAGVLQENFGQAIITAAFVDDILSLVLFNVLFSLKGDFDVVTVVLYPIIGVTFMGIAMVLAVKFWPWAITEKLLPMIPSKGPDAKIDSKDEVLFLVMMLLLVAYATITHFLGTHLWGCFIAGMSFACLKPPHHCHHVWVMQTKRITAWMIRIFFAATVAFSIPIGALLSFESFWKGSIMGIGPCILTKVFCAPFMGETKFVIGWAMVGRAEFAYLIAQMAAAAEMIDGKTFSIVIWALLYATIFAPFIFRAVLNRYLRDLEARGLTDGGGEDRSHEMAAH